MTDPEFQRVLGEYGAGLPGPLLIVVAGLHGNEPSGVEALRRVLTVLQERKLPLKGRLLALAGNLAALRAGVRYLDQDLNRIWSPEELAHLAPDPVEGELTERREQRELLAAIETARATTRAPVHFLDLHSTSGDGPPFVVIGDTLQNRRVAFALGIPVILGLEENVEGTMMSYFGERGHLSVGVEGGQHERLSTVDHHESAVWLALTAMGMLADNALPELAEHRASLARAADGLPQVVEVRLRHQLEAEEEFTMEPGFQNFEPVSKGRLLAHAGPGGGREVHATMTGLLLLPRYQGQGREGFFLGRRVRRFWLGVSTALRRAHADGLVALLPGVTRPEGQPEVLVVDQRIARWLSTQLFHLLGYRRCRQEQSRLVFIRRAERPANGAVR